MNVEGYKANWRHGISGGHELNGLFQYLESLPCPEGGSTIVPQVAHPTIAGIANIDYRIPRQDKNGNLTGGYRYFSHPKTVFDSKLISEQQIYDWAMEAFTGTGATISNQRKIVGTAKNGLKFVGYLDANDPTKIKTFYFTF